MLKFCSLYSSSSGNCLFVKSDNTNILIDVGVSLIKIENALNSINILPQNINAILVTHEHSDHIKSLGNFSKKYNTPVYASSKTWNVIGDQRDKISLDNQFHFCPDERFSIGDFDVLPFNIPHDAIDPCGFNLYCGNEKISIATDLGHIDNNIMNYLNNSSFIMIESNYDEEVLKFCSYPSLLKRRISSSNGHLSNSSAGKVISTLKEHGLKCAMLGHLSKESNFPELAYSTTANQLNDSSFNLFVADRQKPSDFIVIA